MKKTLLSLFALMTSASLWAETSTWTMNTADGIAEITVISAGATDTGGDLSLTKDGITATSAKGYFKGSGTNGIQIYKTGSLTITAATGYNISSIVFQYPKDCYPFVEACGDGSSTTKTTAQVDVTFTPETPANSFTFTNNAGGQTKVKKMVITYAAATPSDKTSTTTSFGESAQESYTVEMGAEFVAPTATVSGGEGLVPTYSSSKETVATVDATTGAVTLVGAGTTTIKASFAGNETYSASSASYNLTVIPVFNSLEALVAADIESGTIVKVSFSEVAIKSFYVTGSGYKNGVYFDIQKENKDIEIYYRNVPEEWVVEGTLSGTMTCPWKVYNGTWELAPDADTWNWTDLTYAAPSVEKTPATISFTYDNSMEVGEVKEYGVTYDGDGTLTASSSNEAVAVVSLTGTTLSVAAKAAGTTTIKVSAPATDLYQAAELTYTLTVTEPLTPASLPFAFDGGKAEISPALGMIQSGLGSDYNASPKLKFDGTGDNLVIAYNALAVELTYTVKGNSFSGGTFAVQESADGETYTDVKVYTELGDAQEETVALQQASRFVKFIYVEKSTGNVALGKIGISAESTALDSVVTSQRQEIYDLTGRRVNAAVKGIYLINGKKVVVK